MTVTIQDYVEERGITEVLHFTTNRGLLGVLAKKALLNREDLTDDQLLESVHLLNCAIRKDPEWTGYVSLSLTAVNSNFLSFSRGWHPPHDGLWWTVLSFSPDILSDPGVVFTTTNNTYHDVVKRGEGLEGLQSMFAPRIAWGYYGTVQHRRASTPLNMPTHLQAEVLYPGAVALSHLEAIYVPEPDHIDEVKGFMASIPDTPDVPIDVRPEVFL